ncbi:MAG: hypothetical protein IJ437_03070 [Clostridia bacterium]|nr:hypothetical protein [Clostridia bacterium]
MKKICIFLFTIIFLLSFPILAFANEVEDEITSSIENELEEFKSSIPKEIIDYLPEGIFEGDYSLLLDEGLDEKSLLSYIIDYFFAGLGTVIKSFSGILVLILISSIFEMLGSSFSNTTLSSAFTLASGLCVALTVFNLCYSLASTVSTYIQTICSVMTSFAPIMTTLQIMGGKITSATISNASIVLFISVVDGFLVVFMLPLVNLCLMFSCIKALGGIEFGAISKLVRNTFTSVTVFVMSVFMFIFSFKNVLSQGADSLSVKTARFAISSFVPIVGASINDALRTVSSSLSIIKNSCGVVAIICIALIMLPITIYIFLNKVSFGLLASISKTLHCEKQAVILEEADSLCSYMLTLVCTTCVLFIFAITIFIKTSLEVV